MVNRYSGKFWRDNNYYANHKTQAHKDGMKASPQSIEPLDKARNSVYGTACSYLVKTINYMPNYSYAHTHTPTISTVSFMITRYSIVLLFAAYIKPYLVIWRDFPLN